eukprot:CAMPEP_0197830590 /NCGR_PEP_ID=MMETSP1437-20131217/7185_1 /TAXON_ID=49252 ORGANISM="Eucampia antarctica, Strain CCMP1452" /NCGR_SAMPLE_ID=MMETSP1437 /ASSEMBLY_ACC=CAM_ASM_001096 /LENGTH=388 /DNA_ID=CAMNT_0043433073 /DNA_START=31 /DNA_END=1197 /DNA_ORIENTATION=-
MNYNTQKKCDDDSHSKYGAVTADTNFLSKSNGSLTLSESLSLKNNNFDKKEEEYEVWPLRRIALDLSLYVNIAILLTKVVAYAHTFSLSVLAALVDSVLDVVSQLVLSYTEKHSSLSRSSALYPAGASRLEPVGVLTCAALMGMASFEILKESLENLFLHRDSIADDGDMNNMGSFWSMTAVVLVKLLLLAICRRASSPTTNNTDNESHFRLTDPTLEALALDHRNDCLSNAVAAAALLFALRSESLWFLDPLGALAISLYIIHSWYETGKQQIEQLTGKCAPEEFIDELYQLASTFDDRMIIDVCRAYHFGPKFLVEVEVVLPKDTLLFESHDRGMELQYEIESRDEVERCFVHIDYETRPYDEHVVSKVPELRAKYRPSASTAHSV